MKFKDQLTKIIKHPIGVLYGTLLGIIALKSLIEMFSNNLWDAALVDLAMAIILIYLMLKCFVSNSCKTPLLLEKTLAWIILILANVFILLPTHNFIGSISCAMAFSLMITSFVMYFSGIVLAAYSFLPSLWCCVFMPYHEEIMLLASFPLRLSAAFFSSIILNCCGINVIYNGTSLTLLDINIAITDACSGINQLDAFILIAFLAVNLLHKQIGWKILHFAFVFPSIILGNTLRIVLTVFLYKFLGNSVLENTWHTSLGYVQIILAIGIFLAIGKVFSSINTKGEELEK